MDFFIFTVRKWKTIVENILNDLVRGQIRNKISQAILQENVGFDMKLVTLALIFPHTWMLKSSQSTPNPPQSQCSLFIKTNRKGACNQENVRIVILGNLFVVSGHMPSLEDIRKNTHTKLTPIVIKKSQVRTRDIPHPPSASIQNIHPMSFYNIYP